MRSDLIFHAVGRYVFGGRLWPVVRKNTKTKSTRTLKAFFPNAVDPRKLVIPTHYPVLKVLSSRGLSVVIMMVILDYFFFKIPKAVTLCMLDQPILRRSLKVQPQGAHSIRKTRSAHAIHTPQGVSWLEIAGSKNITDV